MPTKEESVRAPSGQRPKRKPYQAPAILHRDRLEFMAATCTPPAKSDAISCPAGPVSS